MSTFEKRPGFTFLMAQVGYTGDDCVVWPYSCCTAGYGEYMVEKKRRMAHREMCRMTHGEPPSPDLHAAHSCGNRRCVNPRHLSWKTPAENQLDRRIHGTRMTKRTKITPLQAGQIRQLKGKETSIETAAKYGVTESNVRLIQDGKIWRAERKHRMSISDDQVRAIRKIGRSQKSSKTALALGIPGATIRRVLRGDAYKGVV